MAKGVVYSVIGSRRDVVALDADTGEIKWVHSENEGERGDDAPRRLPDAACPIGPRTRGANSLCNAGLQARRAGCEDRRSHRRSARAGVVDLKMDDDQQIDLITGEVGLHAAPTVAGNTLSSGGAPAGRQSEEQENVKGYVRGFDVKTGKRLWIFHTIPKPGEFGYNTWENDSADYTGNTGVWGQISVDEELGHGVPAGRDADGRLLWGIVRATACSAKASWPWI